MDTTNAIEGLNSQLRKVTNNKRVFPSDDSVFKTLYLTIDLHYTNMEYAHSKFGRSYGPFFDKI
uniref:transposase n=1 Tax=Candidatus Megaera polyxenophila TaxID=988779 RepID=UPI0039777514